MNRWQGTAQLHGRAQFLQGLVRLLVQQLAQLLTVAPQDLGLTAGVTVAWADVSSVPALLQELFDHPQGNAVASSYLFARTFLLVTGSQYPFPQVQRQSSHGPNSTAARIYGYSFI
jgi:hypothetical protein